MEWASAVNAIYCPVAFQNYSDFNSAQLIARTYTGVHDNSTMVSPTDKLNQLISSLLILNNDASVLEIDNAFSSVDRDRLNLIIQSGIFDGSGDEFIHQINNKVKEFEKNHQRLDRLDVYGLFGTGLAFASKVDPVLFPPVIAFGGWIAKYALKGAEWNSSIGSRVIDWLRGMATNTSATPVFINRVRGKAQKIK